MLVECTKIKHTQANYKVLMDSLELDKKNVLNEKRYLEEVSMSKFSISIFAG